MVSWIGCREISVSSRNSGLWWDAGTDWGHLVAFVACKGKV